MDFFTVLQMRHSVRDFRSDPVPREKIETLIKAASSAPSAGNAQPWRFHVTSGATRQRVGTIVASATMHLAEYMDVLGPERYEEALTWYSSLGDAPVVIVISMDQPSNDADASNKLLSMGAAIENLLLAATAEGLGACNITFAQWVRGELRALLEIDEQREILAIVAVGYPGSAPSAAPPHNADIADWYE